MQEGAEKCVRKGGGGAYVGRWVTCVLNKGSVVARWRRWHTFSHVDNSNLAHSSDLHRELVQATIPRGRSSAFLVAACLALGGSSVRLRVVQVEWGTNASGGRSLVS